MEGEDVRLGGVPCGDRDGIGARHDMACTGPPAAPARQCRPSLHAKPVSSQAGCTHPAAMPACVDPPWSFAMLLLILPLLAAGLAATPVTGGGA